VFAPHGDGTNSGRIAAVGVTNAAALRARWSRQRRSGEPTNRSSRCFGDRSYSIIGELTSSTTGTPRRAAQMTPSPPKL
jgi:hypothetical protein